jgi:mannose-1-phosphate guanylyltransferase
MDIERDIAYPYTSRFGKGNGKILPPRARVQAAFLHESTMSNSLYALILAGGSGERFWPLSRRARPKQLLRLVAKETLLEQTVARLEGLVAPERLLILTNIEQEAAVRQLLPKLPKENIVAEPAKRDTAAAVALGAGWVASRDHSATMIVLPADHVIEDTAAFQKTLTAAAAAAEETGALVTIGVKPTWACPGYGYIEQGEAVRLSHVEAENAVHRVVRFREKPNADLAESFLRKKNFRWNAGMFVWSVPSVLSEFNRHTPELASFISQLRAPDNFAKTLRERFSDLPRISFDYAIMEKADRVLVVEAGFDWDDVGSWRAVAKYFKNDAEGNAANCEITALESTNNIVFNPDGTRIALLGVHNLIVVRTRDAILICHRHQAEKIKNLLGKIPEELQ